MAAGVANGELPSIVRIGAGRRMHVVHRFAPNDTPGALALLGANVVGIDGLPESAGRAFVVDGDRFRSVFSVPDNGYGTIAFVRGALMDGGYAFGMEGGRGPACRMRKGHSACGAIEAIGRDARARRIATFASPAEPIPLAGDGRSAWFAARDPARLVVVRQGRVRSVATGGRVALDATPFGTGALVALRDANAVDVASLAGTALATFAAIPTGGPYADATLRARDGVAYALISGGAGAPSGESRLYVLAPPSAPRLIRSWESEFVRLHFVDVRGGAVLSTERRTVGAAAPTTRGTLVRIAADGRERRLPLGVLGERAAVEDAIEARDGAVWSLLTFYGSPAGVVRSDGVAAAEYPLQAGTAHRLRKN